MRKYWPWLLVVPVLLVIAWAALRNDESPDKKQRRGRGAAPVEVVAIERGAISERRVLAATMESPSHVVIAAHVGGRVHHLSVDLGDTVTNGQIVAELDRAELDQSAAQAAAEVATARVGLDEATRLLEFAEREQRRAQGLSQRGVVSDTEFDRAQSDLVAKKSAVDAAQARLERASAALRLARVRSDYAKVIASWKDDKTVRAVAERHVNEGAIVAPGQPLYTIVDLHPIEAVAHVGEIDYSKLAVGQPATVRADAFPDRQYTGVVRRIAPVFRESSRQARIEIEVANDDRSLHPGMFARVDIVLQTVKDAVIVVSSAIVKRNGQTGIFVLDEATSTVSWRPVEIGLRDEKRVQILAEDLDSLRGRVVSLGQQLVDDGSTVVVVGDTAGEPEAKKTGGDKPRRGKRGK